jgi:N-acetylmuramoyl-L-alanine amidase
MPTLPEVTVVGKKPKDFLTYLVVHCSDTPPTMDVQKEDLEQWHKSPRDNPDGTVTYLGKTFANRSKLPNDSINGSSIYHLTGRGWDRLGYSDMIHRDGKIENITPYDDDNIVDPSEITWGATGVNSISRHIVLVGGWFDKQHSGTFKFKEIFTLDQFLSLKDYIIKTINSNPQIKIVGHRDIPKANKTCPNFDVKLFCKDLSISTKNIGL